MLTDSRNKPLLVKLALPVPFRYTATMRMRYCSLLLLTPRLCTSCLSRFSNVLEGTYTADICSLTKGQGVLYTDDKE